MKTILKLNLDASVATENFKKSKEEGKLVKDGKGEFFCFFSVADEIGLIRVSFPQRVER